MDGCSILNTKYLEKIKDTKLFYPCSGNDLHVPIELFSPYVTDFLFVDRGFFSPRHRDTVHYGFDAPADKQRPVLDGDTRYVLKKTKINGPPYWPREKRDIIPCILSETYMHRASDREVRIHRRRGYGFSALRTENWIEALGVFFYRGDSQGEGGSGNHWLRGEHLEEVLTKLIPGGLLVLDGSDGSPYKRRTGIYRELCKYTHNAPPQSPEELIASMNEITDEKGRHYNCVGYAGERYGPTMIWQVHSNIYRQNRQLEQG